MVSQRTTMSREQALEIDIGFHTEILDNEDYAVVGNESDYIYAIECDRIDAVATKIALSNKWSK